MYRWAEAGSSHHNFYKVFEYRWAEAGSSHHNSYKVFVYRWNEAGPSRLVKTNGLRNCGMRLCRGGTVPPRKNWWFVKRRDAFVQRRDGPATVFTRRDRPTPFVLYKIKEREGGGKRGREPTHIAL